MRFLVIARFHRLILFQTLPAATTRSPHSPCTRRRRQQVGDAFEEEEEKEEKVFKAWRARGLLLLLLEEVYCLSPLFFELVTCQI